MDKDKKILVLGSAGMLGSQVIKTLTEKGYEVTGMSREDFDAVALPVEKLFAPFSKHDYVINCIGVIKPFMAKSPIDSIRINSLFPRKLANFIKKYDLACKLIHITTDCVYSGESEGYYKESSPHDALDDYGKSKSLGEPENCMVIRTSIIGEEVNKNASLIEWVKSMKGETISGYQHHTWNGVTTATYAAIIDQIISEELYEEDLFHVHSDAVNKFELMHLLNDKFELGLTINPVGATEDDFGCNRTLASEKGLMKQLKIPTLKEQIQAI